MVVVMYKNYTLKMIFTTPLRSLALCCVVIFSVTLSSLAQAKSLAASVDRTAISLADTFVLQVQAKDLGTGSAPDFSVLNKNFRILSNNISQSRQNVNGVSSQSTVWQMQLQAKAIGQWTIPAFSLAGKNSEPIQLSVKKAAVLSTDQPGFSLTLSANKSRALLGEQIIITERFVFATGVNNLRINPFLIDNAQVTRLEDKSYEREVNGTRMGVYEIRYAIFPTAIGALKIPAQQLSVDLGRQQAFSLQSGQRISLETEPLSIEIASVPLSSGSTPKTLLVADTVQLTEQWSADSQSITLGDSITREINLQVTGALAQSLSALLMSDVAGINIYPEAGVKSENKTDRGITLQRSRKFAIVPTQAGRYILPTIEIHWWDSLNNKAQVARLKEKIITVKPAAVANNQRSIAAEQVTDTARVEPRLPASEALPLQRKVVVEKLLVEKPLNKFLLVAAVSLSLLAALLTGLLVKARRQLQNLSSPKSVQWAKPKKNIEEKQRFSDLIETLDNASQVTIHCALQRWVKHLNINDWHSDALRENVQQLEQSLYAKHTVADAWDKAAFKQLIEAFRKAHLIKEKKLTQAKQTSLAELYPNDLKRAL